MTCPDCKRNPELLNCETCHDLLYYSGTVLSETMKGDKPTESEIKSADLEAMNRYRLNKKGRRNLI